jgi:hypothetical protein
MKTALARKASAVSFLSRIRSNSSNENLSELAAALPFESE